MDDVVLFFFMLSFFLSFSPNGFSGCSIQVTKVECAAVVCDPLLSLCAAVLFCVSPLFPHT